LERICLCVPELCVSKLQEEIEEGVE